jgi:hypothetical protein
MKTPLFFIFLLSFNCFNMYAGESAANGASQNSYVAIRSLVTFLEFSEAVRWTCCEDGRPLLLIPGVSPEEIRATLVCIENALPLSQKREELLKRFGNQEFLEDLNHLRNPMCALSQAGKKRLVLLAQSVVIMVEALYRKNKIAAEHKNHIQHVCEALKEKYTTYSLKS